MSVRVEFRWPDDLVRRIDSARRTPVGEVSRSAFVRDAVEMALRLAERAQSQAGETPDVMAEQDRVARLNTGFAFANRGPKRATPPLPKPGK